MPKSIPKGITVQHVLSALAELDLGVVHPFGEPLEYQLIYDGKRYAPKAVIGLAARFAFGQPLRPTDFSSGISPGQAVHYLRNLGLVVEAKVAEPKAAGADWSQGEVDLIVADYFSMLYAELNQQSDSKSSHRNSLKPLLAGRSDGSVEFKHQNISAVLVSLGLPYIEGYKPRGNFQAILAKSVEEYIEEHLDLVGRFEDAPRLNPSTAPMVASLDQVFEPPPDRLIVPQQAAEPWISRRGRRIDFARRDAENRRMGKLGEQYVIKVEKRRLQAQGRDDLAGKVEWVADTRGDGLGFDVLSFEEKDESERLIEVKTTGLGKFFPFYVSANEVRCSEAMRVQYHLYRVFDFSQLPRLYTLQGALSKSCNLEPIQYRASF
jgi:hypothetical protein